MASFLHRLGRWCADHPWRTIVAWVLVMAVAGTAAATLMKPLSNEFSMPGSRFEQVLGDLEAALPEAAGASGSVVFTSEGGFTEQEQEAVTDLIAQWRQIDGVTAVTDPFETQAQLDGSADQIAEAREQLRQGRGELDAGWAELRAGQQEIDAGWAQYEGGLAALEENRDALPPEMVADAEAQLADARAQLEAGQSELDAGREELEAGAAQLAAGEDELALGERLAHLSSGMRFVSEDGTVALSQLQFEFGGASLDPDVTAELQDLGGQLEGSGVGIEYSQAIVQDISSVVGATEAIGIAVAAIVLLVMLGGVLAAGLPLLMAMVGVAVGVGGAMALTQFVDMNSATPALALMLGGVRRVQAVSRRAYAERTFGAGPRRGERFPVETDTHFSALLETAGGATVNLMLSFDVWATSLPRLEVYGTGGTLSLPDPNTLEGQVRLYTPASGAFETLPLNNPFRQEVRGIGAAQMAVALRTGGSYLADGRLARHVLEVLFAIEEAARTGAAVECKTTFDRRPPLPAGLTEAEWNL